MKLGFYYHIPVSIQPDGRIYMPAFLGLFIDSIAAEVSELFLFLHTSEKSFEQEYYLKSNNIHLVNLGPARPAYIRFFFPALCLRKIANEIRSCDYLIVRSPTPLAAAFRSYIQPSAIVYMIVGSYREGLKYLNLPWYKAWAVKKLNLLMDKDLNRVVVGSRVLVNSAVLFSEYKRIATSIKQIYTTTLSKEDFFERSDACSSEQIKLLYVGRIDLAKGLKECLHLCYDLDKSGIKVSLSIVGWEDKDSRITTLLKELAANLGIANKVIFHGRKKAGEELLFFYRTHDIYLLPSYHEGFPRTIWEALANCIPVVCTSVGSIPYFLKHEVDAFIVKPRDQEELFSACHKIIYNEGLRRKMIQNGYRRVAEVRLDVQAKIIASFIKYE